MPKNYTISTTKDSYNNYTVYIKFKPKKFNLGKINGRYAYQINEKIQKFEDSLILLFNTGVVG